MKRPLNVLDRFNAWFGSAGGVWQTLGLCVVVVIFEHLHPGVDPQGFQLLYWLTVYSAVTQPVLAFGNNRSQRDNVKILEHMEKILEHIEDLEEEENDNSRRYRTRDHHGRSSSTYRGHA
jgi:hypothetical protein